MKTIFIRTLIMLGMLMATETWAQHANHVATPQAQPNSGIKTLSAQDVSNYLNGRGMGLAKAAELNSYPGPMHVLEVEKELALTPDQKTRLQADFAVMHDRAVNLGKQIVEQETRLNQLFATEKATPQAIQTTVDTLARLQGQLRLTHLDAHLKTKQILSASQVSQYNQLRGYDK